LDNSCISPGSRERILETRHVILCAAENGALTGGKVGGVGDVIAALPPALGRLGWQSTVLVPGYGTLSKLPGSRRVGSMTVPFRGEKNTVEIYRADTGDTNVRIVLFEHTGLSPQGSGRIYCDDGPDRPFATDANKFALFSAACAAFVDALDEAPGVVHLHDWHAAFYCLLRAFDPRFASLQKIRTVFTIHNLAMQGIRPLGGDESSLSSWFPDLDYDHGAVADPRYPDCINPMATAIRLADRVNTVSPTYAGEILRPNDIAHGFHGGEGLEADLCRVASDGRLFGILNGVDYPRMDRRRPGWRRVLDACAAAIATWRDGGANDAILQIAEARLRSLPNRRPKHVLASIGRMTLQKIALFLEPIGPNETALDGILHDLGSAGVVILLGSGDPALEERFASLCEANRNFLFLPGYSEAFAELLYRSGDLFLMPSSFEPCGISQMLAMRAGQPCVVHAVGGLRDTVRDNANGFTFDAESPLRQAALFRKTVERALDIRSNDESRWLRIREGAHSARFTWDAAAMQYVGELYE
jgi:starch synthase